MRYETVELTLRNGKLLRFSLAPNVFFAVTVTGSSKPTTMSTEDDIEQNISAAARLDNSLNAFNIGDYWSLVPKLDTIENIFVTRGAGVEALHLALVVLGYGPAIHRRICPKSSDPWWQHQIGQIADVDSLRSFLRLIAEDCC